MRKFDVITWHISAANKQNPFSPAAPHEVESETLKAASERDSTRLAAECSFESLFSGAKLRIPLFM